MTDLTIETVFGVLAEAAPEIRAGLSGRRSRTDVSNPSGEQAMAADIWADELLSDRIAAIEGIGSYASEERDDVSDTGEGYSVVCDPLDGSSNLKSNNSMGTIVGIYDAELPAAGERLVGAAYVLYGPITTMVTAAQSKVKEYVVREDGSRDLLKDGVELPSDPTVYGFGGRVPDWTPVFTRYARNIERELKLRYGGAMIADVNQVLTYGGVFAYPELESAPQGKLRLQFEGNPIGYIIESAGGRASDGEEALHDVPAEALHQRTPVYVGNRELIDRREKF